MTDKTKGVVAAGSKLTAEAGATMLEMGGNAVDAAVASVLTSFIAESVLSTLGGGGFATVFDAATGSAFVLDFFTATPSLPDGSPLDFHRTECSYGSLATEVVYLGRAASAVPGNAAGLFQLHSQLGKLPIKKVVQPAVDACRQGFALNHEQAHNNAYYLEIVTHTPELQGLYFNDGHLKKAGDRMQMPDLADTLELLATDGVKSFYEGEIAAKIVEDQQSYGGLITREDLKDYQPITRQPLVLQTDQATLLTNPAPSSGGSLLVLARMLAERIGLSDVATLGVAEMELIAEIIRWTDIARGEVLDATIRNGQKTEHLFSDEYVSNLADRLLDGLTVSTQERPVPSTMETPPSTTHVSVIDEHQNAVALTTSPGYLGGYVVPETGIVMNNMLGEPDLNPDGFHAYAPGQRITSMMAPTLVVRDGRPKLAIGSGGGSRLRTAIFQVMTRYQDKGLTLTESVAAPRVALTGNMLFVEPGLPEGVLEKLKDKGYDLTVFPSIDMYFGGTHVACVERGNLSGAGDPRRDGYMAVVR